MCKARYETLTRRWEERAGKRFE